MVYNFSDSGEEGDMSKRMLAVFGALFLLAAFVLYSLSTSSAKSPRITKEELKKRLGDPDIVIVDVRTGSDWTVAVRKIPGAIREDPGEVGGWAKRYPKDKPIILYCA
jgi:predicted sulfurtransferase